LPYAWAYVAWLIFSSALYAAGLALLFRAVRLMPQDTTTAYLLALSAMPFIFETWIGGQVSVVAFFCWCLFFYGLSKKQRFLAGAVLALLLFKPTLVALPVAMLICGRRWRTLAGFSTGAVAMTLVSIAIAGWHGVRAWLSTLLFDSQFTKGTVPASHLAKNVDLNAFLALLLPSAAANVLFIALSSAGFLLLGRAWWRHKEAGEGPLWAATLCFTLVLSPYAPIYDAVLVVAAAALLAASIPREAIAPWLLVIYMFPWITQSFAQYLHLQLFTLALAALGLWALPLKTDQEIRTIPNQSGHMSTGRF